MGETLGSQATFGTNSHIGAHTVVITALPHAESHYKKKDDDCVELICANLAPSRNRTH